VPSPPTTRLLLILRLACTAEIIAVAYKEFVKGAYHPLAFVILAGLLFVWNKPNSWSIKGLFFLSITLLGLACIKFIDSGYQLAQLIELALQVSMPALLALALSGINKERLYAWFRLAIALTFLGHGWYALGIIYAQPPHFIEMTVNSLGFLGMTTEIAPHFLLAAGIMDMLVVIGMFFPGLVKFSAGYAVIWGFLTSAARIAAYVRFGSEFWSLLLRYLPEFLVRVPHFAIPWLVLKGEETDIESEKVELVGS